MFKWGASKGPNTAFKAGRTVTLPTGEKHKVSRTGPTTSLWCGNATRLTGTPVALPQGQAKGL